jgi:uncharacterized protein YcnI
MIFKASITTTLNQTTIRVASFAHIKIARQNARSDSIIRFWTRVVVGVNSTAIEIHLKAIARLHFQTLL